MVRVPSANPSSSSSCTCCNESELRRGPWTAEEDALLLRHMKMHGGRGNWRKVPKSAGLMRCGKSCRLRWLNYLRPDLKRGAFSDDEEELIIKLHSLLGNRWSLIAGRIPGRSDNEIKNYWNFHLGKKLLRSGINPRTHKPLTCSPIDPSAEITGIKTSSFCNSSSFSFITSPISSTVTTCEYGPQESDGKTQEDQDHGESNQHIKHDNNPASMFQDFKYDEISAFKATTHNQEEVRIDHAKTFEIDLQELEIERQMLMYGFDQQPIWTPSPTVDEQIDILSNDKSMVEFW